jgi:drug/metabolite transporter (DMT)-like permease
LRRDWPVIRRNLPFLFLCGVIGFAGFNNLFYLALNHTTAINVAIEQASMPLIVFALNFLVFGIRATALQVIGFVLTLLGVAFTVSNGNLLDLSGQPVNIGDIYMLIAVTAYGVYSVALARKPLIHWLSFITVLASSALLASIPFAFWEFWDDSIRYPDMQAWLVALYIATGPAILSQLCWIRGLEIIGSNRGGVFINVVPIFAALMAIVILGEDFRYYHAIAIALVLSGVWMSQRQKAPPQESTA